MDAPKRRRPGGEATIPDAADVAPDAEAVQAEAPGSADAPDSRTPGLTINEDGSVTYQGKVHRRPFETEHGCVVPPCSYETKGANRNW